MKSIFLALSLFLLPAALYGETSNSSAGIVLYADTPKGVFILLADHTAPSMRGWAAFGGANEFGESALDTAIRETEEETRGYFSKEKTYKLLQNTKPFFDDKFAMFFAKVDLIPISELISRPIPSGNPSYKERGPFAWIPFSAIEPYLKTEVSGPSSARIDSRFLPPDNNTNWFWPVWLHNMRAAWRANAIPWLKNKIEQGAAAPP